MGLSAAGRSRNPMFVFIAVRCLYDVFHVVTECNPGKSFKALSKSSFSALRC